MSLKHVINVVPKGQVCRHLASLFRTPIMQNIANDERSPVHHLCERISRGPLFTFRPCSFDQDPAAETNFTSWWRLLALRTKKESHPMMEDMYLLHECYHLANMPYFSGKLSYTEWRDKMLLNEHEASFFSEAWIYHIHPELRKEFPKELIWADNFTFEHFQRDMFLDFRRVSQTMPGTPDQIRAAKFDKANDLWCSEYWPLAQQVENHMARFLKFCDAAESAEDETAIVQEHLDFISFHGDHLTKVAKSYNEKWREL